MAARKFDQERLDKMIEAAKGSERPYKTLESKPWSLSPGIARTIVVGSGLSRSDDAVREREAKRIAKWREQGGFGKPKAAAKPKAPKAEPTADEPDTVIKVDEPQAVEVPEAAAAGVDAAYAEAEKTRKRPSRKPLKDGQGSDTAKAIAANREPEVAAASEGAARKSTMEIKATS
jgi:hypothetical protein